MSNETAAVQDGTPLEQQSAQVVIAFSLAIALLIFFVVQLLYRSTTRHTRLITSLRRIRFMGYVWLLAEDDTSSIETNNTTSNSRNAGGESTESPGLFAGKQAYLHSVVRKGRDDVELIGKEMKVAFDENRLKHRWLPTTLRSFDVQTGTDRLTSRRDAVADCRTMLERLRAALGPSFGQTSHMTMRLGLQSVAGVLDPVQVARFLRIYEAVTFGPARTAFDYVPETGVTADDLMFLQQYFYNTILKEI